MRCLPDRAINFARRGSTYILIARDIGSADALREMRGDSRRAGGPKIGLGDTQSFKNTLESYLRMQNRRSGMMVVFSGVTASGCGRNVRDSGVRASGLVSIGWAIR